MKRTKRFLPHKTKELSRHTLVFDPEDPTPLTITEEIRDTHIEHRQVDLKLRASKALYRFLKSIFEPDKPILSFKQMVKLWPGYQKLSKENRQIVREMMECQEQGGPVGSAPIEE